MGRKKSKLFIVYYIVSSEGQAVNTIKIINYNYLRRQQNDKEI